VPFKPVSEVVKELNKCLCEREKRHSTFDIKAVVLHTILGQLLYWVVTHASGFGTQVNFL